MNMGTTFLVAPINHSSSKAMQSVFTETREFLVGRNEAYLKAMNPDDDDDAEDGGQDGKGSPSPKKGAASGRAGGGPAGRLKKSPSQIKTEYLSKLFQTNQGGKTLHGRDLQSPHAVLTKKL